MEVTSPRGASQEALVVKSLPNNAGDVRHAGAISGKIGKIPWRRTQQPTPLLAWRIPWTEEPGELHSVGSQVSDRSEPPPPLWSAEEMEPFYRKKKS